MQILQCALAVIIAAQNVYLHFVLPSICKVGSVQNGGFTVQVVFCRSSRMRKLPEAAEKGEFKVCVTSIARGFNVFTCMHGPTAFADETGNNTGHDKH